MIIKKFEDRVERFFDRPAVKTGERELTYGRLNEYADRVAHAIIAEDNRGNPHDSKRQVALLFEHGVDMIVGTIGALKAGKVYVPLDITYPVKRLLYVLEDSRSYLILTNRRNFSLARQLALQTGDRIAVLDIDGIDSEIPAAPVRREVSEEKTAYILYTSGSTGKPKGVFQTHRNVWYYTRNWIKRFSISESDCMSFFTAFTHDGAVQDIFSALLSGACLCPFSIKDNLSLDLLYMLLIREHITIWHSVPSLYRFFAESLKEKDLFEDIRWLLLGGEPLRGHDLRLFKAHFPNALMANVYGQTESSVASICTISRDDLFDNISLGEPLDETRIFMVDENEDIVETMGVGEIVVACDYIAPGYWQDKESSEGVFTHDEEMGRLYWTGDLGRLTVEGAIKMMGRKDFQVKIRGYRVETGEIETALLQHPGVKETVTAVKKTEANEDYLCAYFVPGPGKTISPAELRDYLSDELPDYMIPRYFITLEEMPLTANGKIDRNRLPEPEIASEAAHFYEAPRNDTEKKIAEIWQEVLGVEKIGINDNFIELGGHSLLVISIISKVHQVFNVELQLQDVFRNPTIKEFSHLVTDSKVSVFTSIEAIEEKDYYAASADQARMFVLNQFDVIGTTYNLPGVLELIGELDRQRFERAFQTLVKRHDALRTSFEMKDDGLAQVIQRQVDFQISYIDGEADGRTGKEDIKKIVKDFIRTFDLSKAPLFRISLMKLSPDKHLLMLDSHHIVSDGVSEILLRKEFSHLYSGGELPPLRLNYRDYSEWQSRLVDSGQLKVQEEYWLERFQGETPVLDLPSNHPRPAVQDFEGDITFFRLGKDLTQQLNQLVNETGVTLFIAILAMYNVLLHKYSRQEDIVIGSIIAGRNHVDLENIVGMFVKTLPLRNYPAADKTFAFFLEEVKDNTLKALENQQYPFSRLVEKLALKKEQGRNPLFDAAFILQNVRRSTVARNLQDIGLKSTFLAFENKTSRFDLTWEVFETEDDTIFVLQYRSKLFKRETMELMTRRFSALIENILHNRQAKIRDLEYTIPIEKEMSLPQKAREIEFEF